MSKNLENEYRALTETEIPDLWNRIEAQLDASESNQPRNIVAECHEDNSKVENSTANERDRKKVISISAIRKMAGLAAAVLCVALLIPIISTIRNANRKNSDSAGSDMANFADVVCETEDSGAGGDNTIDIFEEGAFVCEDTAEEEDTGGACYGEMENGFSSNSSTQNSVSEAGSTDGDRYMENDDCIEETDFVEEVSDSESIVDTEIIFVRIDNVIQDEEGIWWYQGLLMEDNRETNIMLRAEGAKDTEQNPLELALGETYYFHAYPIDQSGTERQYMIIEIVYKK